MGHIVTHSNTQSFSLKETFNLLTQILASVATVAIASAALFWLGFNVIPVFADKAPQMFVEQEAQRQLLLSKQEGALVPVATPQAAEKKILQ